MARRGRRKKLKLKLKKEAIRGITSITLFFLSILVALSFLGAAAGIGSNFQALLVRFFGWGELLFSIILFLGALTLSRSKWLLSSFRALIGTTIFTFSFLGLVHFFYSSLKAKEVALQGKGGGLVGFFISSNLKIGLSTPIAFFALFSLGLISLLIIFNTSFDQFLNLGATFFNKSVHFLKSFISSLKKGRLKKEEEKEEGEPSFRTNGQIEVKPDEKVEEKEEIEIVKPKIKKERPRVDKEGPVVADLPFEARPWEYPPLELLSDITAAAAERGDIKEKAHIIEKTLESFGIRAKVVEVNLGPAVTQYALDLAEGTTISKITARQNDLALALAAPTGTVRIEAPIPGKSLVGIEVPNYSPSLVTLRSILTSQVVQNAKSKLTVALGHDVAGQPVIDNIGRMPHVLIAGATGSGKSVLINSFISTILFRAAPYEVKFVLVDPKRVELLEYNGIPHLLTPVIYEAERVLSALKWTIAEMDRRYKLFESTRARNITVYNELSGFQALPYILIVIDELADLMAFAPTEVEGAICRIAQMSRATGIHLVVATQRPSVDVITGLIKANIPCRIAFNVSSGVDSRVIIDQPGAEKLLGRGDMLYLPPDRAKPIRIQGVFVSDSELKRIIEFLKRTEFEPQYREEITEYAYTKLETTAEPEDELFDEAVKVIVNYDRASASLLQRRLRIGYARAARLLDALEERGIIGPKDASKPREVLIRSFEEYTTGNREKDNKTEFE